jgi:hypothetical protein
MRKIVTIVLATTCIISSLFLATGCDRQGPAEQAGKKADQEVEKMKEVGNTPGPLEKTGKELDHAVTNQTK